MTSSQYLYEVHARKDHRGVDLISDALPFVRLVVWRSNAIANSVACCIPGHILHVIQALESGSCVDKVEDSGI